MFRNKLVKFQSDVIDTAPSTLRPTKEWKKIQILEFTQLRHRISNLRTHFGDKELPNDLPVLPAIENQSEWLNFCRQNEPLLSSMLRIQQRPLEQLLEHQLEWLNESNGSTTETSVQNNDISLGWLAKWIYAGLGCVHLPLEPDVHSVLRNIVRACIRIRNSLAPDALDEAIPLNLLICIISNNFDQTDMANNV